MNRVHGNDSIFGLARWVLATVTIVFGTVASARADLVITPTFDSSITGNANVAAIEAEINAAVAIYNSLYADNVNASILFRYATTGPNGSALGSNTLAQSNYVVYTLNYGTYINALTNDKTTANDNSAVANLPLASAFPNNPSRIDASSADGRAVGLNTPGAMSADGSVGAGGTYDGIVTINSSQPFQFDRTGGIAANKYDAMQSIQHEIDEVLGLGSILPNTKDFTGNFAVRPEDLFRYSAPNTLSLTSSGTASSYFSIDGGTTNLVPLNQNSNGDYGDWKGNGGALVQLAFSDPGTQSDVTATSPEGIALDVIGYDLKSLQAVPEPSTLALMGLGTLGMITGAFRRRQQKANAV